MIFLKFNTTTASVAVTTCHILFTSPSKPRSVVSPPHRHVTHSHSHVTHSHSHVTHPISHTGMHPLTLASWALIRTHHLTTRALIRTHPLIVPITHTVIHPLAPHPPVACSPPRTTMRLFAALVHSAMRTARTFFAAAVPGCLPPSHTFRIARVGPTVE